MTSPETGCPKCGNALTIEARGPLITETCGVCGFERTSIGDPVLRPDVPAATQPIFEVTIERPRGLSPEQISRLRASFPALKRYPDKVFSDESLGPPRLSAGRLNDKELSAREGLISELRLRIARAPLRR